MPHARQTSLHSLTWGRKKKNNRNIGVHTNVMTVALGHPTVCKTKVKKKTFTAMPDCITMFSG